MEIKLYDYTEIVQDDWFGSYEMSYCIGQGKLSSNVIVPLIESATDNEEIKVKINSGGGYVFDGFAIYNALIAAKSRGCWINISVDGLAASIASIIAMAGDEITMAKASMMMIHKPTASLWCMDNVDSDFLKKEADALDQIQAVLNSIYASRATIDASVLDEMINKETWITPDVAVSLGFADHVVEVKSNPVSLTQNVFNNLFSKADDNTRKYANNLININKNNMAENKLIEEVKNNTSAMKAFLNFLTGKKNEAENNSETRDDGSSIYFDGELAVGTKVFVDEEMTTVLDAGDHLLADKRILVIEGDEGIVSEIREEVIVEDKDEQIANLTAKVTELENALTTANNSIIEFNNTLKAMKETKSNFKPKPAAQNFDKSKSEDPSKPDYSREARAARKEEIKKLNAKK